ncbi:TlpA family protein disulfide reductase [Calditrichota bacterium GD2]
MSQNKALRIQFLLLLLVSLSFAQNGNKIEAFSVKNLSDNNTVFEEYKGKITIINFWATWCAACLKEMPQLEKIYNEFKRDQVEVVGVAVMSDSNKIEKMIEVTGVTYPILTGDRKLLQKISNSLIIPQTIILNKEGKIVARFFGDQSYKTYRETILHYLEQSQLTGAPRTSLNYSQE